IYAGLTALALSLAGVCGKFLVEKLVPPDIQPSRIGDSMKPHEKRIEDLLAQAPEILKDEGVLVTDDVHVTSELRIILAAGSKLEIVYMRRADMTVEDAELLNRLDPHNVQLGGSR